MSTFFYFVSRQFIEQVQDVDQSPSRPEILVRQSKG